jgi:uncharacterized protein
MSDSTSIDLHLAVRIPLRDGVNLSANVYTPKGRPEPAPCLLMMTPYVADSHHLRAAYFAAQGLPTAIVDVRGRGNSEGSFYPSINEPGDGYDVVEWLARQSYCNGKVGMLGGSYLGYCQWATASAHPPHLATIVPTAAPCRAVDSPMRNNIFFPERIKWITLTRGRTVQTQINADGAFWSGLFRRWYESGRPFRELDQFLGHPSPYFQELLSHPEPDAWWDSQNPSTEQYARMELPILTITGSYDDDQPGALEHYKRHMRSSSSGAPTRHYLVIGPWDHMRSSAHGRPGTRFGGIEVGVESAIDLARLHLEWYAWTLQGGPKPEFLKKAVAYYLTGAEQWRYADTLEQVTARHEPLFLDSAGGANDMFSAGALGHTPGSGPADSYRYDPRDTTGPEVDAEANTPADSLTDQRLTFALRGRQLIYHSAPLEKDTDVAGFFRFVAWIGIDCPDTDLYVSVHEIASDGSSVRLTTDAIRARYRGGLRTPKLIGTRQPLRYEFDRFTFIARRIRRGHRLRLVIAPMGRLLETLFAQKNFNGGGVVAEESAEDGRPVTVSLFHDHDHPSVLYVPLASSNP